MKIKGYMFYIKSNTYKIFIWLCIILLPTSILAQYKKQVVEITFNAVSDVAHIKNNSNKFYFLALEQLGIKINPFKFSTISTSLNFNIIHSHGDEPSNNDLCDLQVFSNIEAGKYTGLFEAYVQQEFMGHSLLIGQHDLNAHFLYVEPALYFSNSSFGIMPSVSINQSCSIFPIAAIGAIYNYQQTKYNLSLGIYDGDPGILDENKNNLNPTLTKEEGLFAIAEYARILNQKQNTILKLGYYFHTADFISYNNKTSYYKNNYGAYFLLQQAASDHTNQSSSFQWFVKAGIAPSNRNMVPLFFGTGLVKHSLIKWLDNDRLGIAYAQAFISDYYRDMYNNFSESESVIEIFYGVDFLKYFSMQPSIQYIFNPGAQKGKPNELVSMVRFLASF